jgi:RNA polymerase sigma-70 factor (ECF subfamily)
VDYAAFSPEKLVRACAQTGDAAAWEEFVRRFHRLIATVVLRTARRWGETSTHIVDELIQDTYLKLCAHNARLLRSFTPEHPGAAYGYIKVLTANLVHDHFKLSRSQKRGGGVETDSTEIASDFGRPRGLTEAEILERDLLIQEIDSCLRSLDRGPNARRDCRIFWLYYRVGLTASAIAALPTIALSTKGVESTILRLTRQLRQRLVSEIRQGPRKEVTEKGIQPEESF